MSMKQAYQQKADAQLREWKADIDKMMARADKARAQGKIEFYRRAESLKAKFQDAQSKLRQLREAGDDKWEEFKAGVELALSEVKDGLKNSDSQPG